MNSSEEKLQRNEEGHYDGWCEAYYSPSQLRWQGMMVNGRRYGYFKYYTSSGDKYFETGYYSGEYRISDDNKNGYCYIWRKERIVV